MGNVSSGWKGLRLLDITSGRTARASNDRGFGRWDFLEIAGETKLADFRNIILQWLDAPADAKPRVRAQVMDLRRELEFLEGPFTEDFELPPRDSASKPAITFD